MFLFRHNHITGSGGKIFRVLFCIVTIAMLYFSRGWYLHRLQLAAWGNSPFALSGTGKGAQIFAADGFIVLRTEEDGADEKELSYNPAGSIGADGRTLFGGKVRVAGFPEFTAIPGNVYFLINGHVYQCPCIVNANEEPGYFGIVDQ